MIKDRLVGYVIRVRGWITWGWPFLLALAVIALLMVLPLLVVNQARVLREVNEASEINRRLIERGLPCMPDQDQTSEACVEQTRRDAALAEALAAVQAQHDQGDRNLEDAINRLVELQARQHGFSPEPLPSPEMTVPPPKPRATVPRITTTTVRRSTTTVRPTTTVAPTTTTACKPPDCKPNKENP